jgi:hypothetical protein
MGKLRPSVVQGRLAEDIEFEGKFIASRCVLKAEENGSFCL